MKHILIAALLLAPLAGPAAAQKPNIVFIYADDWGWKLALTGDGKRAELHNLAKDRAEASDVAKENPEIVARLMKLVLDWKATLPEKPNPECITRQSINEAKPAAGASKATPEARARAFARWDTNKDDILTLDEYRKGLKGQADIEARFKNFDKNSDGKLTREEFTGSDAK